MTGESLPIDKSVNDLVRTGTINQNGQLLVKTIKTGEETTLNQIIKMVLEASSTKSKITKLTDKISTIFVPSVIGISLITFSLWLIFGKNFIISHSLSNNLLTYSISRAISVLVISCPCALGLATPVAIMVASGKGARNGILFKNASVLEKTGQIDIAVFDKTGTLTIGKPVVTACYLNNIDEHALLNYVYSLEIKNNHPYGKALLDYSKKDNPDTLKTESYENIPGYGIKGNIQNNEILIVKESYLKENNIINPFINVENDGTQIVVLINNEVKGLFVVSDVVREDAIKLIENLKKIGISTVLLSGDSYSSTKKIADYLGVNQFISNVLPNQKYKVIKQLQEQGKVLMVGDGINDSVALTQADVGIAIGKGSDIAIDAADIVLAKDSLLDIFGAINLSKIAKRNIIENLFWAFFYNIIMIPIAAGALSFTGLYKLPPYLAALAMSLSSITVVLNSLRINLYNVYKSSPKKMRINYQQISLESESKTIAIGVDNMMCEHCKARVENTLRNVDEVDNVTVSLENKSATINLTSEIDEDKLKAAIEGSGYKYRGIIS